MLLYTYNDSKGLYIYSQFNSDLSVNTKTLGRHLTSDPCCDIVSSVMKHGSILHYIQCAGGDY